MAVYPAAGFAQKPPDLHRPAAKQWLTISAPWGGAQIIETFGWGKLNLMLWSFRGRGAADVRSKSLPFKNRERASAFRSAGGRLLVGLQGDIVTVPP
jgi:hypothetical protein